MAFGMGLPELGLIFLLFMLLFGGNKIKELGSGVGQAFKELRKASRDLNEAEKEIKKS